MRPSNPRNPGRGRLTRQRQSAAPQTNAKQAILAVSAALLVMLGLGAVSMLHGKTTDRVTAPATSATAVPPAASATGRPATTTSAPASSAAPSSTPMPYVNQRLTDAMAANIEVVGWITVEGTKVDYPVVQAKDNTYYLTHDAQKKKSSSGAIFLDYRCDAQSLRGNNILYGHHMKDGSMFASLVQYENKDFFEKHRIIRYDTAQGETEWEIFSAYVTDVSFYYIKTDFSSDAMYLDFLKKIQNKSKYKTDIVLTAGDDILTLSTCTYEYDNARFVIHARRIR